MGGKSVCAVVEAVAGGRAGRHAPTTPPSSLPPCPFHAHAPAALAALKISVMKSVCLALRAISLEARADSLVSTGADGELKGLGVSPHPPLLYLLLPTGPRLTTRSHRTGQQCGRQLGKRLRRFSQLGRQALVLGSDGHQVGGLWREGRWWDRVEGGEVGRRERSGVQRAFAIATPALAAGPATRPPRNDAPGSL